jgi:hypothetical protein
MNSTLNSTLDATRIIPLVLLLGLVGLAGCATNVTPGPDAAGCYNQAKHHGHGVRECLQEVSSLSPR